MTDLADALKTLDLTGIDLRVLPYGSMLARIRGELWRPGTPYRLMTVVEPIDEYVCEICGLDREPTLSDWKQLERALAERGYEDLEFWRIVAGEAKKHRRDLRRLR